MEAITTDVTIRGPMKHGTTGGPHYEATLPKDSPAQEYIKGTPCASGPTPYAAMMNLASKYPWSKEGGPLVSLEFAGPVADQIVLDYHTCPDCGKDEREDERHGGHYFVCEADPANAGYLEGLLQLEVEDAAGLIEDAYATEPDGVPDLRAAGWLEDTLALLCDCGAHDGAIGLVAKVYVTQRDSLSKRLHPTPLSGVLDFGPPSDGHVDEMRAELKTAWEDGDPNVTNGVWEWPEDEVRRCHFEWLLLTHNTDDEDI